MRRESTLPSRRDLDFLLYEWLRIDELTKRERFAEHSANRRRPRSA
jgi:hypothetical protein